MAIFEELNRRGVVRAAAMYIAIAWGGTEILVFLVEALWGEHAADPARKYLAIMFVAGFPVVIYLAWTRDLGLQARRVVAASTLAAVLVAMLIWLIPEMTPPTDITGLPTIDADPKSIAVLPFVNMSGNEDAVYFSHGISEELLNLLARIPDLKVSSRTSSFHFAGREVPLRTIAAQLGVRHILEGSVRRSSNLVRITAQLIDAKTDTQLWSENYDREVLDMFAVQEEIAGVIAEKLQLSLTGVGLPGRPTENEDAYDKFLRGWHFVRQGVLPENYIKARDYFQAAIELDPNYAKAHALLSVTNLGLGQFRHVAPKKAYSQALEFATTALELDENLPEAHFSMGWVVLSYEFDWRKAEKSFRRAIELAPGNYMGHHGLNFALSTGGRLDEALSEAEQAFELDPLTVWTRIGLAEVYYKRREHPLALEQAKAVLEMQAEDALMLSWIGSMYAKMNMPVEALQYAAEAARFTGDDPNLELNVAWVQAELGNGAEAREILDRVKTQSGSQYVSPGFIAIVYASLGETDLAVDWLHRAVEAYDSVVFNLNYPDWDPISSDPRYIELCDRLKVACVAH